jgi:hypothetical protein
VILHLRNGSTIEIGDAFSRVTFADGAEITGAPQGTEAQEQQARELGISVAQMVAEHDPLHEVLAAALGLPCSAALRAAVERSGWSDLTRAEEGAVLALQAYLARLGIRVEEAARRMGVIAKQG